MTDGYADSDFCLSLIELGWSNKQLIATKGFSWTIVDETTNRTVAHEAASLGALPDDFDQWELKNRAGKTVAHIHVRFNSFQADSENWRLKDDAGNSVARVAIASGTLPADFDQWDADAMDPPLPHMYLEMNEALPPGFKAWEITDLAGDSIAHRAADKGVLPEDFTRWDILSSPWDPFVKKESVADRVRRGSSLRQKALLEAWLVKNEIRAHQDSAPAIVRRTTL